MAAVVWLPGIAITLSRDLVRAHRLARDQDRPVALAHRRTRIHHPVSLVHERVGGGGNGRDFQLGGARPAVQRLDVLQHVRDLDARNRHLARGEGIEHEGIVGVGAMADPDQGHALSP